MKYSFFLVLLCLLILSACDSEQVTDRDHSLSGKTDTIDPEEPSGEPDDTSEADKSENEGGLTVMVSGIQESTGTIRISLWNSENGWPEDKDMAYARQALQANSQGVTHTFTNVPYGTYAIALFHDVNDNQEYDRGVREDNEPFGFSSNADPRLGPPPFEEAAFKFSPEQTKVTVQLND